MLNIVFRVVFTLSTVIINYKFNIYVITYYYNNRYTWKDVLYDVTWSELNDAVCVVASGDGNVLVFDFKYQVCVGIYRKTVGWNWQLYLSIVNSRHFGRGCFIVNTYFATLLLFFHSSNYRNVASWFFEGKMNLSIS